jgi:hypothetical protein
MLYYSIVSKVSKVLVDNAVILHVEFDMLY